MAPGASQVFSIPAEATIRRRGSNRLAPAERERLWKGLERFINCGDSVYDFQALSRAFPSLWPTVVENADPDLTKRGAIWNHDAQEWVSEGAEPPAGARLEQVVEYPVLDWNPACHKLFLFYRDILRTVWSGTDD